jgi:membrane-associated protein
MFDISNILTSGGLVLLGLIIFGESGMFIGFFFPGDTLLLSAGVFAAAGKLNLLGVIIVVAIAAILGDNTGYHIGKRYGKKLFCKPDGAVFRKEHITQAKLFYDKYGSKTMLFAHFIPVVRTFAPATAGAGEMDYKSFVLFDAIGDTAWAIIVTLIGYYFGSKIHNLDHYILLAVLAVVITTLAPTFYHLYKTYNEKKKLRAKK